MGTANRISYIIRTEVAKIPPRISFSLENFKDYTISCFKENNQNLFKRSNQLIYA